MTLHGLRATDPIANQVHALALSSRRNPKRHSSYGSALCQTGGGGFRTSNWFSLGSYRCGKGAVRKKAVRIASASFEG